MDTTEIVRLIHNGEAVCNQEGSANRATWENDVSACLEVWKTEEPLVYSAVDGELPTMQNDADRITYNLHLLSFLKALLDRYEKRKSNEPATIYDYLQTIEEIKGQTHRYHDIALLKCLGYDTITSTGGSLAFTHLRGTAAALLKKTGVADEFYILEFNAEKALGPTIREVFRDTIEHPETDTRRKKVDFGELRDFMLSCIKPFNRDLALSAMKDGKKTWLNDVDFCVDIAATFNIRLRTSVYETKPAS